MKTASNRTIITSKTTGRRYYLARSSNRSFSRRYYLCSRADCSERVAREADLLCRTHSQSKSADDENIADISTKSDDVDENGLNDNSEIVDGDTSIKEQTNTKSDVNNDDHENDSTVDNDVNTSLPLTGKQKAKADREVHVDEATGARTFRDGSGRRRYLCREGSCTSMLKCQADRFCRIHLLGSDKVEEPQSSRNHKRYSAPPSASLTKSRFRSPFTATTTTEVSAAENGTNGNHSEEYESPQKTPEQTGSNQDASGKERLLCANPSCDSPLVRQSDTFCKRHLLDDQDKESENNAQSMTTDDIVNHDEANNVQQMDVNHNNTETPSQQTSSEPSAKKRKHDFPTSILKTTNHSSISSNKIVISSTALLDAQWTNILTLLRQFPQVELSTNLNVNNSTTHLLVDDTDNHLHCIITKKIVQAAVRRHVFIISSRWINECIRSNEFIDEHPYEIISDSHTTLRLSIQNVQPKTQYLFNNSSLKLVYGFAVECRQCQGSINRNELIELVELTGAILYDNKTSIDLLVVLCDSNEKNINKIKEKYLNTNVSNIKYVTSDFLLKSIIKFEIQDITKYVL